MLFINTVLPIFLLILVGYFFAYFREDAKDVAPNLMKYVFWIAAPALIFSSISNYHIEQIFIWQFWLAYLISIVLVLLAAYVVFRLFFKDSKINAAVAAFASTAKNTVIIGFPVLYGIGGQRAAVPMVVSVIIFSCFFAPSLIFICEAHAAKHLQHPFKILAQAFKNILKNPLVCAALAGIVFSVLQISLQPFARQVFNYFSDTFIPCALFVVGIELYSFKFERNMFKALMIAFISLIICPLVAIVLAYAFKLSAFYAVALVVFSAMPTAKAMIVYVSKYERFNKEVAMVISLTTVLSVVTIPLFIWLCYMLWPSAFQHLLI